MAPQCTSARGRKNLAALVFSAAEFFKNIFTDVWTKQSENAKHSKGRKKYQVLKRYNIHAGIILDQ